jgi:hypothetical protein
MKPIAIVTACLAATALSVVDTLAQTSPPAPVLVEPAGGAAVVQPFTLRWAPVVDPDGPIASYTWQLGTTSAFTVVIASGFTDARNGDPIPTSALVSGIPNGSYFWRIKGTQTVGGAVGFIESAWSAARSVTVTALGAAPGTPAFSAPLNGSRFHPYETFNITWSAVPGAHYYLLEADDQANFSHPLTLNVDAMVFGTKFNAGWGNEIPNIYYRVRAVSVDNVRGLPSATLNVRIVNTAPIPPPPSLVSPVGGATVSLPFTFDWTDTANPQIPGYDLDVDDEPTFGGAFGVLLVQNISRSDYTLVSDLAPGTYFWRIRALHGNVPGPWSAGQMFRVVASPPMPPGLNLYWMITEPGSVSGGHPTQARVTLNGPAPPGGATVRIMSDMPHSEVPENVFIPAGATDAIVSPVTSVKVQGAVIGNLRAAYAGGWQQSSLGLFPLLFALSLDRDTVVGGNVVGGTVTLKRAAPAGGVEVTLVSSNTALVRPPAHVFVPEGETAVSFTVPTAAVSVSTPITINTGTADDGYRAPETWLNLLPVGSAAPAPMLASVTVATPSVLGGGTTTGRVTLTAPAPPSGASVWVNGSMEGQVVTPPGDVVVPAGSLSADFTITAPQVNFSNWVLVQARYRSNAGMHAAVLRIDPDQPAVPNLLAFTIDPISAIGGNALRATVGLATPAPAGGTTVFLSSDNPAAQMPTSVHIPAGNSATSFTIATSVVGGFTSVSLNASSGRVTKTTFLTLFPDPNAGTTLSSVTPSVSGTQGGNSINATLFLSRAAPAGGARVTLSSSNPAAAQVPASVTVPAGLGFASFTIATSPVANDTTVTITGTYGGVSRTATITVLRPPPGNPTPPPASVDMALSGVPASIRRGQRFTATGTVSNTGGSSASGYTVLISIAPSNAIRLDSPRSATQSVAAIAAGGSRNVSWQLRAERTGSATVAMTLRNAAGATVRSVSRTMTITN